MRIRTSERCVECGRAFDLFDERDAEEWAYGHDCEPGAQRYVAGWNIPGYLPETAPETFTDRASALAYLMDAIERASDGFYSVGEPDVDAVGDAYAAVTGDELDADGFVTLPTSDSPYDLGVTYWVTEAE